MLLKLCGSTLYRQAVRAAHPEYEMDLLFWAPAILLPSLLFIASAILRAYKSTSQTAVSDFLTLFIIFDGLLVMDPEQVVKALHIQVSPHSASIGGVFLVIILLITWVISLIELEPKMHKYYAEEVGSFPLGLWCISWAIGAGAFLTHAALVTGRIM